MFPITLTSNPVAAVSDDGWVPRLVNAFFTMPEEVNLFSIVSVFTYFSRRLFVAHRDGLPLDADHLRGRLRLIVSPPALLSLLPL